MTPLALGIPAATRNLTPLAELKSVKVRRIPTHINLHQPTSAQHRTAPFPAQHRATHMPSNRQRTPERSHATEPALRSAEIPLSMHSLPSAVPDGRPAPGRGSSQALALEGFGPLSGVEAALLAPQLTRLTLRNRASPLSRPHFLTSSALTRLVSGAAGSSRRSSSSDGNGNGNGGGANANGGGGGSAGVQLDSLPGWLGDGIGGEAGWDADEVAKVRTGTYVAAWCRCCVRPAKALPPPRPPPLFWLVGAHAYACHATPLPAE
jgi:hypothetical protein